MKSMRGIEIMEQNGKTRSKRSAIIIMGLALFATQFGAGNLIFPEKMGIDAGSNLWRAFAGVCVTAVGILMLAVVALGLSR